MSAVTLPNHATLTRMRREAKTLRAAVRSGDPAARDLVVRHTQRAPAPDFPLHQAQWVVARAHGFASWPRLKHYLELAADLGFDGGPARPDEPLAHRFCRLACLDYADDDPRRRAEARAIVGDHPELAADDPWVAAAAGDVAALRAQLGADPTVARRRGGPHRWTPLYYLAYSRALADDDLLPAADLLLTAGADPTEGYLWAGQPTPFTVLTGALGGGELGSSRQPAHPLGFARRLLEAGADANDAQALYNRQFEPADDHLRLLLEFGLGAGDGGRWRRLLGDAVDSPAELLAGQLHWAIEHGMTDRVDLLLAHDVDPHLVDRRGRGPVSTALAAGHPELVPRLLAAGADPAVPDPADELLAAALSGDRAATEVALALTPDAAGTARSRRPGALVWAAALHRSGAVELLLDLGWDVDAFGRGDVPVEQPWQTALHTAAGDGDAALVDLLLRRGARTDLCDARFGGTAADWADHFGHEDLANLLRAGRA